MKHVLLMVLWVCYAPAVWSQTLEVRADPWCPYTCDDESEKKGYMIELLKTIFEPQGLKVSYSNLSWKRALDSTRKGRYNAVVGAFRSDAPDFVFPESHAGISRNFFYALPKSTWQYTGPKSLQGQTVGIIRGYTYGDDIDELLKDPEKKRFAQLFYGNNALDDMIESVRDRRIMAFIDDTNVVAYSLAQKFPKLKLRKVGQLEEEKVFVAFSPAIKESKRYAQMFDEGMKNIRKKGELAKILSRYNLEDWKKAK
ncbi:substrate-binding periplasmic protein [Pseudobacteriovorax antillogorgiicola]|uniref:Amino acid ABC transporter substrate-binding protein, PAAT family n=1 Tax=Pseudobacteriovorax antillogorgiicola TaxID=1513793 RepID=A0A1Y6BMX4_9BACT|nr:transporter substrate-binding domain-containing protein [Pseudobacteriovorax antillogorgiicola]TCS56182.1 amino acid ABC transporter substrate-binding protein (PAAT family) [Pseudobacteriovorax antillogorgiicola]SMF08932.1 amino acid ABC transporter substrate-binding protein, PAAT family [Pseudobacteriovorax antillogorgiicola]